MAGKPDLVSSSPLREGPISGGQARGVPTTQWPIRWIDDRQLSFAILSLFTAGALYISYIVFRPFLSAIFLAIVLAIAFAPLQAQIEKKVRNANAAALLSTVVVVLFILVPCIIISIKFSFKAASLYGTFSQQWTSGARLNRASEGLQRVAEGTGIPYERLRAEVMPRVQQLGTWMVGIAGWAARSVVQQGMTATLIFFILFFLFRDKNKFRQAMRSILPLPRGRIEELETTIHRSIVNNFYGMFAVGLAQGIMTGAGFWITGLRAPLFWGLVAMIFSFVPLVGPILVWVPGAILLLVQGEWVRAVVLLLWGVVFVSGADYVIRPRFAGGKDNANTLLVLLSFLGGVKAFGVIGIFVGPVVLSLIIALVRILREERAGGSAMATQPIQETGD